MIRMTAFRKSGRLNMLGRILPQSRCLNHDLLSCLPRGHGHASLSFQTRVKNAIRSPVRLVGQEGPALKVIAP